MERFADAGKQLFPVVVSPRSAVSANVTLLAAPNTALAPVPLYILHLQLPEPQNELYPMLQAVLVEPGKG